MSRDQNTSVWFAVALCFVGGSLILCPANVTDAIRATVHDLTRPGQLAVRTVADAAANHIPLASGGLEAPDQPATDRHLLARITTLESKLRELAVVNLHLQDEVEAAHLLARQRIASSDPPPLLRPELVTARVIGEETLRPWQGRALLASGSTHGVPDGAIVLADEGRTLLDVGADRQLTSGESVFAGRTVLGKIIKVTSFTSTVQRVTDRGYRGAARLSRETADGKLVFGQAGTLEGDGSDLCRLKLITEPVNVGDHVYTANTDGILLLPMYYGQDTRAELKPGATEWEIQIRPAPVPDRLTIVHVLRTAANPARVSAN
jgi:cell shape-determining protein MreC